MVNVLTEDEELDLKEEFEELEKVVQNKGALGS